MKIKRVVFHRSPTNQARTKCFNLEKIGVSTKLNLILAKQISGSKL